MDIYIRSVSFHSCSIEIANFKNCKSKRLNAHVFSRGLLHVYAVKVFGDTR